MALDEALLDCAEEDLLTLRIYAFTPATISLGYFQSRAAVPESFRERFPLVRRSTGGGAIVHTPSEVTISFTGKAQGRAPRPERAVEWLARGLGAALEPLGIRPRLAGCENRGEGREDAAREGSVLAFLCGAIRRPLDIVADLPSGGAVKIFGSAQRRCGRAWLIHGSLPIRDSRSLFPEGTFPPGEGIGIAELIPRNRPDHGGAGFPLALRDSVLRTLPMGISRAVGVEFTQERPTVAELRLANHLVATRHAAPEWIDRRNGPCATLSRFSESS